MTGKELEHLGKLPMGKKHSRYCSLWVGQEAWFTMFARGISLEHRRQREAGWPAPCSRTSTRYSRPMRGDPLWASRARCAGLSCLAWCSTCRGEGQSQLGIGKVSNVMYSSMMPK